LALIHLKSNNEQIAKRLSIPETFHSLDYVRPAFLLQKILCRNLIMWDSIGNTKEWVMSQIPELIREIYMNDFDTVDKKFGMRISLEEIDFATVALCYVNISAGAVFSIGFKYAGTGNKEVRDLILFYIEMFRKVIKTATSVPGTLQSNTEPETKNQVDRATIETGLCVLAFSLSMVMAGTCDIETFRTLRILRKRFEVEMHYGYNMAINMAIGFVFLGNGAYTFNRSDKAIAALLCSLYPVFPNSPSDNRHHLQAMRHFYVMAIETRLLQARDIDTGNFVNI